MSLTAGRTAIAEWTCVPGKIAGSGRGGPLIGGLVIGEWLSDGCERFLDYLWELQEALNCFI